MSVSGNACPRTVFITAVERVLGVWSMRAISKTVEGYYRHRPGRRSRAGDLGRVQLRTGSAADLLHVHFEGQYRPAENSSEEESSGCYDVRNPSVSSARSATMAAARSSARNW